ncbi:hypothetical protein ABFA07_022013 [Porites harrisoni]
MLKAKDKKNFYWLFICFLLVHQCSASIKKWLPNTNFNNPANWDKRRLPSDGEDVKLDKGNKPLAVSLRRSHLLKSLSLPINGEVIFYDGAEIQFCASETNSCSDSGDIHFLASVQDWYNPYNWQDIASLASSIILHTDNVPCVHDTAVFPQGSSFLVSSSIPVKVAAVELFGQRQSSKSFKDFYSGESGRLQFNLSESADITAVECIDSTGCPCGTWKLAENICSHVKCKDPGCAKPFKPEGSCCDICGTLLELSLRQDFNMASYRDLLMNVSQKGYEGVTIATSKTEAGFVQVVLTDQENGMKAQIASEHLKDLLTSEKAFSVDSAEVLKQSATTAVSGKKSGKPKNNLVIPLAVGLTILFLFLVTVLFLIFRRTKRIRNHSFKFVEVEEFELDEMDAGKEEAKLEKQYSSSPSSDKSALAMANPLYESAENENE